MLKPQHERALALLPEKRTAVVVLYGQLSLSLAAGPQAWIEKGDVENNSSRWKSALLRIKELVTL